MRILLVEDNESLAQFVRRGLEQHGFNVDIALRGREGEELAMSEAYDLVLLDVLLPDHDGMELCRNLRRFGVSSYILMLSGLSETSQIIRGLEMGADDYLTKPFEFQELLARIRALLRRGTASEATELRYDGLVLDLRKREARRDGRKIYLRPKEFAVLELLLRNADRVVDRMTIAEKVWDMNAEPSSNAIDQCLSLLRRRIDRGFDRRLIHTVIGSGYRLGEPPEYGATAGGRSFA